MINTDESRISWVAHCFCYKIIKCEKCLKYFMNR